MCAIIIFYYEYYDDVFVGIDDQFIRKTDTKVSDVVIFDSLGNKEVVTFAFFFVYIHDYMYIPQYA